MSLPEKNSASSGLPSDRAVSTSTTGGLPPLGQADRNGAGGASRENDPSGGGGVPCGWRGRVWAGMALAGLAMGVLGAAYAGLSSQVVLVGGGALAALALIVAVLEGVGLIRSGGYKRSSLALFPVAGVVLVALAAGAAISTAGEGLSPWFLIEAPILCAAALILGGAELRWRERRVHTTEALLFPESRDPLRAVESRQNLSLSAGMVVPADTRVTAGSCSVLERWLSPRATFRIKDEGEIVFAGSVVLAGSAEGVTLSGTHDSVLQRLEALVKPHVVQGQESVLAPYAGVMRSFALTIIFSALAAAIAVEKGGGVASEILLAGGVMLFIGATGHLVSIAGSIARDLITSWARAGFISTRPSTLIELLRVSKVVIDPSWTDVDSVCEVRHVELLDDRIGEAALCACVASLLGRAEDMSLIAAGDYCQRLIGKVVPERIVDLREYEGRGVCGSLKGIEVSIGSEDFIVERGIMLQPSDIVAPLPDERVLLVAIDNDVIARFWIHYGQSELTQPLGAGLWPTGVAALPSSGAQGELNADTLLIKGKESAVLGRSHTLQVARFTGERFELPSATLVALTPWLHQLPAILRELHAWSRKAEQLRWLLGGVLLVAAGTTFAGMVSVLVPITLIACVAIFLAL